MKLTVLFSSLVFVLFFTNTTFAFRLEPMVVNFTPDGPGASQIFRVENDGKDKIAVKLEAFTREIDENGKETTFPSKDFKIYPDQLTLEASDSRAVRVMYMGVKDREQEAAYRIVASQLPVEFKENKKPQNGIKFLFQFVASAYVTNDKYYPKVEVESVSRSGKDNIRVKVINRGQKHVLLKDVNLTLFDTEGKPLVLDSKIIKNWEGENLLSGTRRTFKIKSSASFDIKKNPPKIEIKGMN